MYGNGCGVGVGGRVVVEKMVWRVVWWWRCMMVVVDVGVLAGCGGVGYDFYEEYGGGGGIGVG